MSEDKRQRTTLLDKLMIANIALTVGAGAYHGYNHAQGNKPDINTFAGSTLYGPSLLMGGFASLKSLRGEYEKNPGQIASGFAGFFHGGVLTAVGYGLGFLVGMSTRQQS